MRDLNQIAELNEEYAKRELAKEASENCYVVKEYTGLNLVNVYAYARLEEASEKLNQINRAGSATGHFATLTNKGG